MGIDHISSPRPSVTTSDRCGFRVRLQPLALGAADRRHRFAHPVIAQSLAFVGLVLAERLPDVARNFPHPAAANK